jgi:transcriptional regulator with XRE-family HTH domain
MAQNDPDTSPDGWARVGQAITNRVATLQITKAELARRSGVTYKTLERYLAGEPIVRVDKRRELTRALGWAPGSVEALLAGGRAVVIDDDPGAPDDLAARLDAVEAELAAIRSTLEDLADRLSDPAPRTTHEGR